MIPLAMIPWRLVGYGVAAMAVVALGWRVHAWREAYKALPDVQAALAAEEACADGSKCGLRVANLKAAQAAFDRSLMENYEAKLTELRNRPVPDVPVRLCRPARPGGMRVPGTTPATGAGGGSELPVEVGRDIAVELYRLADDADVEALKLKSLWQRDVALSEAPDQPRGERDPDEEERHREPVLAPALHW